jgi:RNA polymerase sigma-70 factor, ECF subfamily
MNNTEQSIILAIQRGDKEVFRKLFDVYYKRFLLYAKSYVTDPADAEDIVQNLFFNLWEKREELIILTSLTAYLFRALHNRCIQYLRHKKVAAEFESFHLLKMKEAEIMIESSDFSFTEIQFKELQHIIEQTSESLPEKTREIFKLSRESYKTNKEIAGMLDIQIKTVEYHISKALKVFYYALKDFLILFLPLISIALLILN